MAKKQATKREEELLLKQQKELALEQVLRFSKKRFKKFDEIVNRLYAGEDLQRMAGTDKRIWKINACFQAVKGNKHTQVKKILKNAFIYLDECSGLITEEIYIQAVFNSVQFHAHWQNDLFQWKPCSKQKSQHVYELLDYLFCKYPVPSFLYKAFFDTANTLYIHWFIHLAIGKRVKDLPTIPIPFTQKMGHWFLQAPVKLSVVEALRWAQVMGLGGDAKLADRIAVSWLSIKPFQQEDFWETFLHILVKGGMFNLAKATELIDYVRECKRENLNYTLKGRTLQSLLRQSDDWHGRFSMAKGNQFWKPSGLEGFTIERKVEIVRLEELTESKLLAEEGRAMKHCVGSYTYYCAQGKTAIFSMRKYTHGVLLDILATIEVNIGMRKIIQAKAKMNKPISDDAKRYLDRWAADQGLLVNTYL